MDEHTSDDRESPVGSPQDSGSPWRYDGKRVVVTGCSSGIGEALAESLSSVGATVVGIDRDRPSTRLTEFYQLDLSEPDFITEVAHQIGRIDCLFNCAGISGGTEDARTVMRINFFGLRALTEALVPMMPSGSAITSIASLAAVHWRQRLTSILELLEIESLEKAEHLCDLHPEHIDRRAYPFSKECVLVWSKLRCIQLANSQIRMNTIGPGVTDTPILSDASKKYGQEHLDTFPKPLGRIAAAIEQARALMFLNSGAASFITGNNLWVDGGYEAGVSTGQLSSWYD